MILYSSDKLHNGTIIVCPMCEGTGNLLVRDGGLDNSFKDIICYVCDGHGRVIIRHEKIKV